MELQPREDHGRRGKDQLGLGDEAFRTSLALHEVEGDVGGNGLGGRGVVRLLRHFTLLYQVGGRVAPLSQEEEGEKSPLNEESARRSWARSFGRTQRAAAKA